MNAYKKYGELLLKAPRGTKGEGLKALSRRPGTLTKARHSFHCCQTAIKLRRGGEGGGRAV